MPCKYRISQNDLDPTLKVEQEIDCKIFMNNSQLSHYSPFCIVHLSNHISTTASVIS